MIRQIALSGAAIVSVVPTSYLDLTLAGLAILFGSAFAILSCVFENRCRLLLDASRPGRFVQDVAKRKRPSWTGLTF
jgi:hypothetical protein